MPRKQKTEEQKAQTELTEAIEKSSIIVSKIRDVVSLIESTVKNTDNRTACCALRDYAQLLVARHMDQSIADTETEIGKLRAQLHK